MNHACDFLSFPFPAARGALCIARGMVIIALWLSILSTVQAEVARFGGGSRDGYDLNPGAGGLDYPWVNNAGGATNVTPTSVWLNGALVCTGSAPATVHVYWGETNGGTVIGDWAQSHDFGVVDELGLLTFNIAVNAGSVYYYRFYATNSAAEEGWAPESAVFQAPSAPTVSTGYGAGAGITTAVLYGELTGGLEVEMWVDWGETTEGIAPGSPVTIAMGTRTEAGTAVAPNPFYETISVLTASTIYAYRVRATNDWGAATSPWAWFTTHPTDFIIVTGLGGPMGGHYDGYDRLGMDGPMPGWRRGTTFTFR